MKRIVLNIILLFLSINSVIAQDSLSKLLFKKFSPNIHFDTYIYNHNDSTCCEIAESCFRSLQLADLDSITIENKGYLPITISIDSLKHGNIPTFQSTGHKIKKFDRSPRRTMALIISPKYKCVQVKPKVKKAPVAERILGLHSCFNDYYKVTSDQIIILEKRYDSYLVVSGKYKIENDYVILETPVRYSFSNRLLVFTKLEKRPTTRIKKVDTCLILKDCVLGRDLDPRVFLDKEAEKNAFKILNRVSRKLKRINRRT